MMTVAASTTDIRHWLQAQGIEVRGKGRIRNDLQKIYDDAHRAGPGAWVPAESAPDDSGDGLSPDDYSDSVTAADFPPLEGTLEPQGDPGDLERPAADRPQEARPRKVRAPRRGPGLRGLLGGRPKPASGRSRKARPKIARVSLAGFIEEGYSQLAWLASGLPPMQRMLQAQSPYAGLVLEDALRGTMVDRALQPIVRGQEKAEDIAGVLCPPAALMAVLMTAPQPEEVTDPATGATIVRFGEPTMQHKTALVTLRWSLSIMAKRGALRLDEYIARAEATEQRGREADKMMAFILGMEPPPETAEAAAAEEDAVRRAQEMFRGARGADNA
jgi:hypothetical protein